MFFFFFFDSVARVVPGTHFNELAGGSDDNDDSDDADVRFPDHILKSRAL